MDPIVAAWLVDHPGLSEAAALAQAAAKDAAMVQRIAAHLAPAPPAVPPAGFWVDSWTSGRLYYGIDGHRFDRFLADGVIPSSTSRSGKAGHPRVRKRWAIWCDAALRTQVRAPRTAAA